MRNDRRIQNDAEERQPIIHCPDSRHADNYHKNGGYPANGGNGICRWPGAHNFFVVAYVDNQH